LFGKLSEVLQGKQKSKKEHLSPTFTDHFIMDLFWR